MIIAFPDNILQLAAFFFFLLFISFWLQVLISVHFPRNRAGKPGNSLYIETRTRQLRHSAAFLLLGPVSDCSSAPFLFGPPASLCCQAILHCSLHPRRRLSIHPSQPCANSPSSQFQLDVQRAISLFEFGILHTASCLRRGSADPQPHAQRTRPG